MILLCQSGTQGIELFNDISTPANSYLWLRNPATSNGKITLWDSVRSDSNTRTATLAEEYITKYHFDNNLLFNNISTWPSDANNVIYGNGSYGKITNSHIADDSIWYRKLWFFPATQPDDTLPIWY